MGDRRFDAAYRTLAETADRAAVLHAMADDELVHALAAASRRMDAYLANVLAVELLNRQRRHRALTVGLISGLAGFIALRTLIMLPGGSAVWDPLLLWGSFGALAGATVIGFGVRTWMTRRP